VKYKLLGQTGIKVSELCFGTMSFGGDADEKTSGALFNRCREAGINFFDCANVYAGGRSEEILGKLIADCRGEVIVTSKGFAQMGSDMNARGASRRNLHLSVEASLKRLNTDYLDVYFVHQFDDDVPLDQTLRALDDLVKAGKILYPAASNFASWQYAEALGISAQEGLARFEVIQPMYNLTKRQAEVEILPMAKSNHLGVISYSPLGAGLLTGKYGKTLRPDSGRLTDNQMYQKRYHDALNYDIAEGFANFARERDLDPASLAVAWVAGHPAITAPIIGARNVEQLDGSLKSVEIEMTPELYSEISALSPEPPVATDRAEDKT
jgi:aryl-alcohol dehydrogenase-like predicted oxidoreductase